MPAVIHKDGTNRIRIVREETDPFFHSILKALGRRLGVEATVNTSLNVGTPIVQTPAQAIKALHRSRGMTGLLLVGQIKPPRLYTIIRIFRRIKGRR